MRRILLLILMGAIFILGASGSAHARFIDVVRQVSDREQSREAKSLDALEKIDPKTISADEEKAAILFSRGLAVFEVNPAEAKANFESAQKLLAPSAPLYGLVSIYQGRASLNPTNARKILANLQSMTKGNINKSPMWRPEKFALMLEIIMILKQDRMLARTWSDMSARVKPAMRDESLSWKVIDYLEQRDLKVRPELWPIVESMASQYPHSKSGRWAFQKLQELTCLPNRPYVYSLALITRLAANVNLDEGLKFFLIELTNGQVRHTSGRVARMDEYERVTFLFQNRFWNEARRIVEERVDEQKIWKSGDGRIQYARSLNLLGQIQVRQGDYEDAARTWSLYLELFQNEVDPRPALENLADSLARLRFHGQAAKIYELLAKNPRVDPVIRWHHFWNVYLSGNYTAAIELLDRGNYVPQRDRGIDGGLDYWRARILEKLNKSSEAVALYNKILNQNGDSFYSSLTQARRPDLIEALRRNVDPNVQLTANKSSANSNVVQLLSENIARAENLSDSSEGLDGLPSIVSKSRRNSALLANNYDSEIRTVTALNKWGQRQIGRRLLRLIPSAQRKGGEGAWVESFRLAIDLKDYAYGFKSPQMQDSPLRQIPNSAPDLEVHMIRFNPDWKLLYPYAYRDIVDPVASAAGVDPFLVLSLMRAESVYDIDAQSPVGARGLMQIMPFTAIRMARAMQDSRFELSELQQPEINIGYAAQYLRKLADYYKDNMILAVAAYNGGPASVDRWLDSYGDLEMDELIETMSFRETRRYVKSVYKNLSYYKFIWQQTRALAALPSVPTETADEEIF